MNAAFEITKRLQCFDALIGGLQQSASRSEKPAE